MRVLKGVVFSTSANEKFLSKTTIRSEKDFSHIMDGFPKRQMFSPLVTWGHRQRWSLLSRVQTKDAPDLFTLHANVTPVH